MYLLLMLWSDILGLFSLPDEKIHVILKSVSSSQISYTKTESVAVHNNKQERGRPGDEKEQLITQSLHLIRQARRWFLWIGSHCWQNQQGDCRCNSSFLCARIHLNASNLDGWHFIIQQDSAHKPTAKATKDVFTRWKMSNLKHKLHNF